MGGTDVVETTDGVVGDGNQGHQGSGGTADLQGIQGLSKADVHLQTTAHHQFMYYIDNHFLGIHICGQQISEAFLWYCLFKFGTFAPGMVTIATYVLQYISAKVAKAPTNSTEIFL